MKYHYYLLWLNFIGLIMLCCPAVMAENTFQLSEDQINNLGISLGKLKSVKQISVLIAPAKVMILPNRQYRVSASQVGIINKLIAVRGDKVEKGEVLIQINSPDLLSMQRLYIKSLNELQLGSLVYQRDKQLIAEGIIADRRWQESQSQYNAFVSAVNEQKQLLEIAGMSVGEIDHLSKSRKLSGLLNIHAPISGVVIDRMVAAGERVDMLAPLYHIANLDELWVELNVPPERIASVKLGDEVLIQNTSVRAKIILIGQSVNPENQTVLVRAMITGNQSYVRAGQTINAEVIEDVDDAFKVPNTALSQNNGKYFIFIHEQGGFSVKLIKMLAKQSEESIISGDFTGSEDIAIRRAVALKAMWLGLGAAE